MKRSQLVLFTAVTAFGLLVASDGSFAQTLVFSDTFGNGSTVNLAGVPTSDSTAYQIVSAKSWNPTPGISSGNLQFGIGNTSGGTVEAQALFSATPITLGAVGNYVDLNISFVDTSGILESTRGFLGIGMYDSYGSAPIVGGLDGTASSSYTDAATGGVQNWQGYVAQIADATAGTPAGDASRIMYRLAQTGGTGNNNQDLVTSGSGSMSYHNPEGSAVGSSSDSSANVDLTAGQTYTENLKFTRTASGIQIDSKLSNRITSISTLTGVDTAPATYSFNGLAIGYYSKDSTYANQFDLKSISVTALAVPEPSTFAFAALGMLGAFLPRLRRRK